MGKRAVAMLVFGLACGAGCASSGGRLSSGDVVELETFSEVVSLRGRTEFHKWERAVRDTTGKRRMVVWLSPLSACWGGTVAFEFGLSWPGDLTPNRVYRNLLGERSLYDEACRCYPEVPFEIDIAYVTKRVMPRFGDVRRFAIPGTKEELVFEVLRVEVGEGVGDCKTCPQIDRITARVSIVRG